MTLELPPDGAHGMAAHVTGKKPERLEEDAAKPYPARPAALRAEEHQPAAPPARSRGHPHDDRRHHAGAVSLSP
jgi:hypothetical protein